MQVYSYIFRLHGQAQDNGAARESGSSGSRPSASRTSSSTARGSAVPSQTATSATQPQQQRPKNGAQKILAKLMLVNGSEKVSMNLHSRM